MDIPFQTLADPWEGAFRCTKGKGLGKPVSEQWKKKITDFVGYFVRNCGEELSEEDRQRIKFFPAAVETMAAPDRKELKSVALVFHALHEKLELVGDF